MPNIVTYCRVSSEEQAEKDFSIPAQRKALRHWAAQQGHTIVQEFVDEGVSAYAPADKRPGFCEMISFCRKGDVAFIVVHKLDRFSRNREESILFKSLLRRHDVQVKSITEHFDPETPQGFLFEGMIEVINQFYSMNLATEVLKGLKENASRGWSNGGRAPYGYRKAKVTDANGIEHTKLILGPEEEVAVVREIFELSANHGQGGKTIAQMLNARSVPSPGGRLWRASTVNAILANETYAGDLVWFKTRRKGRDRWVPTDESDHVIAKGAVPAIVERELFDQRQTVSTQRQFAAHTSPHRHVSYLLGRLIRCESCGGSFVGRRREYTSRSKQQVTATAYYCSSYLFKGQSVCRSLPIDQQWIEAAVLDAIRARLVELDGWTDVEKRLTDRIEERRRLYGVDPNNVAAKVTEIDRKIANYYRAIGEGLDPAVCKSMIAELTAKKEELERESEVLLREDYYTTALQRNLDALQRFRARFAEAFEKLPFGVQRAAVLVFIEKIAIRDRSQVEITLKVPMDNVGITALTDEVEAVKNGTWTPDDESEVDSAEASLYPQCPDRQSGPKWWLGVDSNHRHCGYEPHALTN
jgi:site-specific DNA recombinase